MSRGKRLELVGQKFNKLLVICKSDKKLHYDNGIMWECICDCGNKCIKSASALTRNRVKSCGCLIKLNCAFKRADVKENSRLARSLPYGEAAFNELIHSYKKGAKRRNLEYNLTKDQFRLLAKSNCYYCNKVPSQIRHPTHCTPFTFNGIDRIDNDKGYIIENCVTCCKYCNNMKHSLNVNDFLNHIKLIYEKQFAGKVTYL